MRNRLDTAAAVSLAHLWLRRAAEDDPDLMAGYRSVDPGLRTHTAGARVRLALYRVYPALIMRVESVSRAYGPDHGTTERRTGGPTTARGHPIRVSHGRSPK